MGKDIEKNIKIHDNIAKKYKKTHNEIYNNIEQERLFNAILESKRYIKSNSYNAVDIGCGAGNITEKLVKLKFNVLSADVSKNFLKLVKTKFPKINTLLINGDNLKEIETETKDWVGTYSVLHHIPNYLKSIDEMCRILKKGGVIYLDHEVNGNFWNSDKTLTEFYSKIKIKYLISNWKLFIKPKTYINRIKRIFNPKFQDEGDIHVFKDDHIEWGKIKKLLKRNKFEIVLENDYLLFKKGYPLGIYNKYKNKTSDYKVLVARKND